MSNVASTTGDLEAAIKAIEVAVAASPESDRWKLLNRVRDAVHGLSAQASMPVGRVIWVPIDMVRPNGYNPNSVARVEMGLLLTSILHDGLTQPVVVIWNESDGIFEIVDGFHRYYTTKNNPEVNRRTGGMLPVVVISKDINDRMASTVRHNRARGKHSVAGMGSMVLSMLENGWGDADICNELGMTPEELVRLKHVTGFSKLFADAEYQRAWETRNQIRLRKKHEGGGGGSS